jgi:hypothetical protein
LNVWKNLLAHELAEALTRAAHGDMAELTRISHVLTQDPALAADPEIQADLRAIHAIRAGGRNALLYAAFVKRRAR